MAWAVITATDVLNALNNAEANAHRTVGLGPGQTDPLPSIITYVTEEVRGYIRARHRVGPTGIPQGFFPAALALITYRLAERTSPALADKRKAAYTDALAFLKAVADGKIGVEDPPSDSTDTVNAPLPPEGGDPGTPTSGGWRFRILPLHSSFFLLPFFQSPSALVGSNCSGVGPVLLALSMRGSGAFTVSVESLGGSSTPILPSATAFKNASASV